LDIVQKIWAPLGKLFAPPGVPRWLRARAKPEEPVCLSCHWAVKNTENTA